MQHGSLIEAEIQSVHVAVQDYRDSLGAFFGRLADEPDPSGIARLAGTLPEPPDLDGARADARSKAMKAIEVQAIEVQAAATDETPVYACAQTYEQPLAPDPRGAPGSRRPDRRAALAPTDETPPDAGAPTDEQPLAATDETPPDVGARVPIDELVPVMDPTADQRPGWRRYLADHPGRPPGIGGGAARRHATAEDVVVGAIQPLTGRTSISRCRRPRHPGRAPATPS